MGLNAAVEFKSNETVLIESRAGRQTWIHDADGCMHMATFPLVATTPTLFLRVLPWAKSSACESNASTSHIRGIIWLFSQYGVSTEWTKSACIQMCASIQLRLTQEKMYLSIDIGHFSTRRFNDRQASWNTGRNTHECRCCRPHCKYQYYLHGPKSFPDTETQQIVQSIQMTLLGEY
jgi:hypothetical protein